MRLPGFLLLLAGCTAAPDAASTVATTDTLPDGTIRVTSTAPADSGRWALVEELRIPAEAVGSVRDLALADDGTIYVADLNPVTIHVFGPDGRVRPAIGRAGDGPGEFQDAFLALRGDTLFVQDRRNARVVRFGRDGTMHDAIPSTCCTTEGIGVTPDGRVLVPLLARRDSTKRWMAAGTTDTIAIRDARLGAPKTWTVKTPGGDQFGKYVPTVPMLRSAFDPTGTVAYGWSGELAFTRGALRYGRTVPAAAPRTEAERAAFAREFAITDARREGLPEDLLIDAYDPALLPERPELFESFWVDRAGRTWVQRTETEGEVVTLELYGADGRWLDVVRVPATGWPTDAQQRPAAWTATHVVVAVESEAGVALVRYRIERQ